MDISDVLNEGPQVGDIVEMELGDVLVETVIDEVLDDGVVIRVNEAVLNHMIAYDKQLMESAAQQAAIAIHKREEVAEGGNTVDSIVRAHPKPVKSLVAGKGISSMDIRMLFNEFLNAKAVSYDDMYDDKGDVVARIIRDWLNKNDVSELDRVSEAGYDDSMSDAEWEREYQREKLEKELARKEIEKNHTSQFKTKEEAIQYANDKLKTFKDSRIGMSVYTMPDGGFDVSSTARTAATEKRRKLISDAGGKHLGTLGPRFTKNKMAEAKNELQWTVEQHTAGHHNAFYLVKGYNDKREVWKDSRGISDFKSRDDAQSKAEELNNGEMDESSNCGDLDEAKYQGREVALGKPMAGDVAKSKVYVKNAKGNVVKVNFGQKGARIKKSNPGRRKSFRARHGCDNPGPRWKAKYWSCRAW